MKASAVLLFSLTDSDVAPAPVPRERARLPLLFSGDDLVWVPGLGVDARFHAPTGSQGLVPEWSLRRPPKQQGQSDRPPALQITSLVALVFEGAQRKCLVKG